LNDLAGTFSQTRKVGDIHTQILVDNGKIIDTFLKLTEYIEEATS
jgi:hypothetical protein